VSIETVKAPVFHVAGGIGGGAKGFKRAQARLGNLRLEYECLGGVDVDPGACRNFERLTGVKQACLDLFSRAQYRAFHGCDPPEDWRETTPEDIFNAAQRRFPWVIFSSLPCKGFSGLLSESKSRTPKYEALNQLAVRANMLVLEAFKDDPAMFLLLENVPRIANRGRHLLDQIFGLWRYYGYAQAETVHDCGVIGGLAQSRKRFLGVGRFVAKVKPFLYEPPQRRLRAVGEVLEKLPLPGDAAGGPMHRIPSLQFQTWLRLAFVEAGKDWRSLERLRVENGHLKDYALVPGHPFRNGVLGVTDWQEKAGTVAGESLPYNGKFSVADVRYGEGGLGQHYGKMRVEDFEKPSHVVHGSDRVGSGALSIADPRIDGHHKSVQHGVLRMDDTAGVVTGKMFVGGGYHAVADPRLDGHGPRFNNVYRVVRMSDTCPSVTGGTGPTAGGVAVADPRPVKPAALQHVKYGVNRMSEPSGVVIGASTTGQGAFAVADPRMPCLNDRKDSYRTGGHFGVAAWQDTIKAVPGFAKHNNGPWNVADPRLPASTDRLVALIVAEDNTWHRPFTTLELAALQSFVDPDEMFTLEGQSDSQWREWIGNAVPPAAAEAVASCMGRAILAALTGETFRLSSEPVWVRPVAIALQMTRLELREP
jgi:site-specific DNA-cytosine methylase